MTLLTGVFSHFAQQASTAIPLPGRPVSLYGSPNPAHRGRHSRRAAAAGEDVGGLPQAVRPPSAAAPGRGPARPRTAPVAALVASAIFQLATGLANAAQWYPWGFGFRETHYAVGWVAVGRSSSHVAVKLPIIRQALAQRLPPAQPGGVTRRSLLRATWLAAGVAVLATAAAGVPGVRRISVLAVRSGDGPGGVPINKSAAAAGVSAWPQPGLRPLRRCARPGGPAQPGRTRGSASRRALSCRRRPWSRVERLGHSSRVRFREPFSWPWSARRRARPSCRSLRPRAWRESRLPAEWPRRRSPCLALDLSRPSPAPRPRLPLRFIIAPNRPGVLQTKWVSRLEVQA